MTALEWLVLEAPLLLFAAVVLAYQWLRFMVLAGLSYWLLWQRGSPRIARLKIQPGRPPARDMRRDLALTTQTLVIFSLMTLFVRYAHEHGWARLYFDIQDYGWAYFLFSIVLSLVLHDAYFYWTHRLFHTKWLMRHVHAVHHRARNPSPWSSFAFHPLEATVQYGIVPLLVLLMPLHPMAIIVFALLMAVITVIGHIGYELYPPGTTRHPVWGMLNTSTHHNMHHNFVHFNFGLYFNLWDRLMGTNHPRYHDTFDALRPENASE